MSPLRSRRGFGLLVKESVLPWYLRPRAGLGAETPSGLFPTRAQLPALSPGCLWSCLFAPRGLRAEDARRLRLRFSPRGRGLRLVSSPRPCQLPGRNLVLLKGVDRVPVLSRYPPPSRPAFRGCAAPKGYASAPATRATGKMLTAAATGVPERFAPGNRGLGGLCSSPPILEKHLRIVSPSGHFCLLRQKYSWNCGCMDLRTGKDELLGEQDI